MSDVEDRLRQDLPALANALIAGRAADSAEVEEPEGAVDAVAQDPGPFVGLGSLPVGRKRRWPAVAAAAATVAAVVGVGAFLLNTTDSTQVTTVDPAAARPDEAPETVAPAGAGESMEGIAPDAGGPKGGLETPARSAAPDGPRVTPAELSSGPVLQWSEIDPGLDIDPDLAALHGIESVGDGRIVARTGDARLVVTTNGTDWTEIPIPAGIRPGHVDVSGDRWLVTGFKSTEDASPFDYLNERIFYSDDEGGTWIELALDLPAPASAEVPYVAERSAVTSALVSGKQIVITVNSATELDLLSLVADRGWTIEKWWIMSVIWGDGTVTIKQRSVDALQSTITEVTYDELGLTADQQSVLEGSSLDWRTRIFRSDGMTLELTAEYESYSSYGVATADGFILLVQGPEDLVLRSTDGESWVEIPMDPAYVYPRYPMVVDSEDSIWGFAGVSGAATVVKQLDVRDDPQTVAILKGVDQFLEMEVGPAGLAAVAVPTVDHVPGRGEPDDGWPWAGARYLGGMVG